ncbi:MAG: integrase [Candidatus Syntrophonatronum acetioxidans]|uniref:Integrase n=1 Tax=Candidatus Syntrophonatronum acetioxidans TaxID=1795816 RepID=A0A424YBD5_9FIRM|nr:MAG: integrase [Candidatus Syntrophonatronum acetioxidans]
MEPLKKIIIKDYPYRQEYISYLDIQWGLVVTTIKSHDREINHFIEFIKDEFSLESFIPGDIKASHIRRYLAYLKNHRENGPSTRNSKLATIRSYYKFLEENEYLEEDNNPTLFIRKAKVSRPLPVFLSLEEAQDLLKASVKNTRWPERDHAVLRFFLQTGCRAGELVKIELDHIDLEEKYVRLLGKGNEERIVPLTPNTIEALKDYLAVRDFSPRGKNHLFLGARGDPITYLGLNKLFKEACRKAGILKPNLTLHKLRHTCLTLLLKEGVDLCTLKELAGHQTIRTTVVYTHVTQKEIREAVKKLPLD